MAKSVSARSGHQDQKTTLSIALAESGEVPIASLRRDPELTCRVKGINPKIVAQYFEAMTMGREVPATFPPVVVFRDPDGALWLADGFHRLAAAEMIPRSMFPADIREGTREDAIAYAAQANTSHGFRRTSADKRRAVAMLLKTRPEWSDVRIACATLVTDKTVAAERKRLNLGISEGPRIGADGKARKAPKAKRGRPKAPRAVRALRPLAKTLERVAKGHPEAAREVERVTEALMDLVSKLTPSSDESAVTK